MLSYLHGFHAGNFADVHKHVALNLLLGQLLGKEAPLAYLDTHAGRGLYDLQAPDALKTAESALGIARLWDAELPAVLASYVAEVRRCNPEGGLRYYPGSPAIARAMLRAQDRLILCELHPTEFAALKSAMRGDRRVAVHQRDGFEGLRALTPPAEKRGLALIDPSYEIKGDYTTVAQALLQTRRRWSAGVFLLWYPILREARHEALLGTVVNSEQRKVLRCEFRLPPAKDRTGMQGSGLLVANPPWQFDETMRQAGEALSALFAQSAGEHRCEWLIPEQPDVARGRFSPDS